MATVTNYYTLSVTPILDGYAARVGVNQTFSNLRSGAGTTASYNNLAAEAQVDSSSTTNQFAALYRNITLFDTSSIPAGATITSATLTLLSDIKSTTLGSTTLEVVSSNPASTSSLTASDYGTLGSTSFASLSNASFVSGTQNIASLNASGLSNITKAGITKFGFVLGWDFNNSFTGSWLSSATAYLSWKSGSAAAGKPVLTVNYTVDFPTLSVNNISSLSNVTIITTS